MYGRSSEISINYMIINNYKKHIFVQVILISLLLIILKETILQYIRYIGKSFYNKNITISTLKQRQK